MRKRVPTLSATACRADSRPSSLELEAGLTSLNPPTRGREGAEFETAAGLEIGLEIGLGAGRRELRDQKILN